ncbi:hypothetical protein C0J45_4692 [Silurus meridionalis]|nr:hypothetical protein C0J45_4692 [Silurus meridionalis]
MDKTSAPIKLGAAGTGELVVDFRRHKQTSLPPVNIQGKDIVRVDSYKYLGAHLNNKLDWTDNTEAIYKKGQSRLFLLRRLRSFGVQGELLKTFSDSVVASAIFYGVVCWGSSISTADRKRLDKLIRKASSVLGIPLDTVQEILNLKVSVRYCPLLSVLQAKSLSEKSPGGGGTRVFCVRSIDGESMKGCSGSADTVHLVVTDQGPQTSSPTHVKEGADYEMVQLAETAPLFVFSLWVADAGMRDR